MEPISPVELRRRLDAAGYDVPAIDRLGQTMGVDLLAILAGWAHILAEVMAEPAVAPAVEPTKPRLRWWRRVWNFLNGEI